ncbi:MAG: hypothetical protein AAB325_11065, partial [Pseudomonadota bacterium]
LARDREADHAGADHCTVDFFRHKEIIKYKGNQEIVGFRRRSGYAQRSPTSTWRQVAANAAT